MKSENMKSLARVALVVALVWSIIIVAVVVNLALSAMGRFPG